MIEEMIMMLTEQLYSGTSSVSYKGIYFPVKEEEYIRPMEFRSVKYIRIEIPKFISLNTDYLLISYEMLPDSAMTNAKVREKACFKLATWFVEGVLPKIDFKLNTIMHNKEVEDILEVLE